MLTWIEVDLGALDHNLKQFRSLIGPKTLLMPVVKSNAYGHGLEKVARFLDQHSEVDRICVVNLEEAEVLQKSGVRKPLIILSFFEKDIEKVKRVAAQGTVAFPLYTFEQASLLNAVGEELGLPITVHLKIDTGMTRIGLHPREALPFLKKISKFKFLNLEGLWSHFSQSEEDPKFTKQQTDTLKKLKKELAAHGFNFALVHNACTASAILYPFSRFDAVRIGLGIYGLNSSAKTARRISLKPCLSMYTKIIQIKKIPKGAKVGYGATFTTKKFSKIAVLPIGYYDGFDRGFSNNAQVLVGGKLCPVRGRICMNLTMVEITKASKARVGDRVVILGVDHPYSITADIWAKRLGTISYEVVTRLNPLLPRIYRTPEKS
jgi:alanine racemase